MKQTIQFSKFSNGGFVLHKLTGDFSGKASAWYDAAGRIIAAEQIVGFRARPVKENGPIWQQLSRWGNIYKNKNENTVQN